MLSSNPAQADATPSQWWRRFCECGGSWDSQQLSLSLFQRLSLAIELFRPEEHRHDPFFVRIWLAYLEAHQ